MADALDGFYRIESPFRKDPVCEIDLALITHPRDLGDVRRVLPWTADTPDRELLAMLKWTRPILTGTGTAAGLRTANVFVPRISEQFGDLRLVADVRHLVIEALQTAERFGARAAVLGGLVSSLMRHGAAKALQDFRGSIRVTTGHTTTALCVCATLQRAMAEIGAPLAGRRVAFLGMGSVGSACASWLSQEEPRIGQITLCDVRIKLAETERLGARLGELGFRGPVRVLAADPSGRLPEELYETDVLVSATSRPDLVDIDRVRPGSVLVDDSQPWCWSRDDALARFRRRKDVLCLEGGLLSGDEKTTRVSPAAMGFTRGDLEAHASTLWSCMGEGLLLLKDATMPPTIGAVKMPDLRRYQAGLAAAGIGVAPLQCGGTFYRPEDFQAFRAATHGRHAAEEGGSA